ncbi:MAG: hypothetical protein TECD_00576 [Hyphomicrobiaceae bacterium hypho_1]
MRHNNCVSVTNAFFTVGIPVIIFLMLINGINASMAQTFENDKTLNETVKSSSELNTGQADLFPKTLVQNIERHTNTLNLLRKAVERLRKDNKGLENQRLELVQLIEELNTIKAELNPFLEAVDREITQLSSPDEATLDSIEVPELVNERNHLIDIRAQIIAAQKRTSLSLLRSQKLEQRIQDYHLQNFTTDVLQLVESPVSRKLWQDLDDALPRLWIQITTIADNWWAAAKLDPLSLSLILIFGSFCYTFLFIIRNHVIKSTMNDLTEPLPGFLRKATHASWFATLTFMPGAVSSLVLFLVGDLFNIWDENIRVFVYTALSALIIASFIMALAKSILQPHRPHWRLVEMPTPVANRLLWITNGMAIVYAADLFLHQIIRLFYMSVEVRILETSLANGAFAVLLAIFALTALPDEQDIVSARLIKLSLNILRIPLLLAATTIIIATFAGYVALGRFIAGQIMLMGVGGIAILLLHLAIRVVATTPLPINSPFNYFFKKNSWLSEQRWKQIIGATAFLANIILIGSAFALMVLSWGVPLSKLTDSLKSFFFGFEIGQIRISVFQILIGACLFIAVLLVTRIVQGWMIRTVLNTPSLDKGIANSIHTGFGYLGMSIAAMVGISYAGVDLTQLTLVIGALSLGVGLGLQSIVNNFVSGLILLIERPVKVGDWIVIGNEQGYVRKISVRATEIETFDRASVIIPNSALISGTVQNWTHRSPIGRVQIQVKVSYSESAQKVHDVLLDVAKSSDKILVYPEPFVTLDDFGSSSLDFSLRCYIANINESLSVTTSLRMEILSRFRECSIEIPYPRHEIRIHNLDATRNICNKNMGTE